MIEAWVDNTAQKGTVLTLYELTEGDATKGTGESATAHLNWLCRLAGARLLTSTTEFHGLDSELLQKALSILVKRGKAQIFGQEDSQGIKFF